MGIRGGIAAQWWRGKYGGILKSQSHCKPRAGAGTGTGNFKREGHGASICTQTSQRGGSCSRDSCRKQVCPNLGMLPLRLCRVCRLTCITVVASAFVCAPGASNPHLICACELANVLQFFHPVSLRTVVFLNTLT